MKEHSIWVSSVGKYIRLRVERRRFIWSDASCLVWEYTITGHHVDTSVLMPETVIKGSDEHDEFEKCHHFKHELSRKEYLSVIRSHLRWLMGYDKKLGS